VKEIEEEKLRLRQKYERQKEARLDEVQAAEKRRQILESEDVDVSISNLFLFILRVLHSLQIPAI